MVTREASTSKRRTRRLVSYLIPLTAVGIVIGIFLVLIRIVVSPVQFRQTIIVVGDPVHVVSFDAKNRRVTALDLPYDTVIAAALGYGKYSIRALLSLDEIDHRDGLLITSSVSNALGLPIAGHMITPGAEGAMDIQQLRRIFSWGSIPAVMTKNVHGSVSLLSWMRFVGMVAALPADGLQMINIAPAIIDTLSPDGSKASAIDESRVDYFLDTAFFDAGIRSEGISVAIYNTTGIPSVGQRASRQLGRVGMLLVFVGNAETEVSRCIVAGSRNAHKTKSAQFIKAYYGCSESDEVSQGKETGADLVVLLGTDFANRYK